MSLFVDICILISIRTVMQPLCNYIHIHIQVQFNMGAYCKVLLRFFVEIQPIPRTGCAFSEAEPTLVAVENALTWRRSTDPFPGQRETTDSPDTRTMP